MTTEAQTNARIIEQVASDLSLPLRSVTAAVELFDAGNTVPFVARYRKEATDGLEDVALTGIQEKLKYRRELEERRAAVLESIGDQGKLTPALEKAVNAAETKTVLEDLYLPFRPKRRTRAMIAREKGLEPLAERMWEQFETAGDPQVAAAEYVDPEKGVDDPEAALQGARDIVAERIAETAGLRAMIRDLTRREGDMICRAARGKKDQRSKFEDYYEFTQPARDLPSHRVLAIRRGEKEGFLSYRIQPDPERARSLLASEVVGVRPSIWTGQARTASDDAYDRLLSVQIETDIRLELKQRADEEAITVFARNLRDLLLAPPFGARPVLAIDPGYRTGCKVAVLDATGRLLADTVVYPTPPRSDEAGTAVALDRFFAAHKPEAVAIGNGTGGRETHAVVRKWMAGKDVRAAAVLVNESGASVYSASEIAREELPDKDVTVRGAVSIGRRLQDPLAELVKIDAKAIGVGQYQHDVDQKQLKERLDQVVESCVNSVGVDVNTASPSLLGYVAGLGPSLARAVVARRDESGPFGGRRDLLKVAGLGPKTYEQCAGFLRVKGGDPLDDSAVHPERYRLVKRIAGDLGLEVASLVGNARAVAGIDASSYIDDEVGRFTLDDILAELAKPGRDPRREFEAVDFREGVNEVKDLTEGMELSGVVTNLTRFGVFVDIGVHQDGLVHISEIANRFVTDPADELHVGQTVKVKVLAVDVARQRISLSIKALLPKR